MKKILLLLIMLSIIPCTVHAQSNRFFLNLGAGLSVPVAESAFSDLYNLGFNVHVAGGMNFTPVIAGRLDLQLNKFSRKDVLFGQSGSLTITSLKADILAGDVSGFKSVNPYGIIGLGAYILSASETNGTVTISDSETDLGIGLGGGVNFNLSPTVGIYTEIQYNLIFNEGAAKGYLPIKVGISLLP